MIKLMINSVNFRFHDFRKPCQKTFFFKATIPISSHPNLNCSFEFDFCDWIQDKNRDFDDWIRNTSKLKFHQKHT